MLVGGEGTRLRPLTSTTPKQMLPVVEQPMIERVVGHLARHGIEDVVLSLGYRPDAFINAYPGGTIGEVSLGYAVEPDPLDTAGAIRFATRHAGIDETFVVVNGDVLTDSNLSELVDVPSPERCRGDDQPDSGRRPQRVRRGADRRAGSGRGLHREAATRRGPHQLHQRRRLCARARRGRADRGRPTGVDRAGDVPDPRRVGLALRPSLIGVLARHRNPRRLPPGPSRPPPRSTSGPPGPRRRARPVDRSGRLSHRRRRDGPDRHRVPFAAGPRGSGVR